MDLFVRNLTLNISTTIEDVLEPCAKIMHWLTMNKSTELTYRDVETCIKSALYVQECYLMFETELQTALVIAEPFQEIFYANLFDKFKSVGVLKYYCQCILQSKDGWQHYMIIQNILNLLRNSKIMTTTEAILDINHIKLDDKRKQINEYSNSMDRDNDKNHARMLHLVQQTLQLPETQIHLAIERICMFVAFDILAQLFLESATSLYFYKCNAIAFKICQSLADGTITHFFVQNMLFSIAHTQNGRNLFYKVLENAEFYESLKKFFFFILNYQKQKDLDYCVNTKIKNHNSFDVLRLLHCALDQKSPCQRNLCHELEQQKLINTQLRNILLNNPFI